MSKMTKSHTSVLLNEKPIPASRDNPMPQKIIGFSFAPLWRILKERNISTYDLEYTYSFNPALISRLKNEHNFTLYTIIDICNALQIHPAEMIEFTKTSDISNPQP